MHKKFLRLTLIIACYAYYTPANSMLLPDQDLNGNSIPSVIRIMEKNVDEARSQVNLGSVRLAQLESAFSNSEALRTELSSTYRETRKHLHAAIDQMCTLVAGWTMVINFSVQHPENPFEADSSNPLWRLICEGLLKLQNTSSPEFLESLYVRPIMQWVNEHGGWKTQADIENNSLQIVLD